VRKFKSRARRPHSLPMPTTIPPYYAVIFTSRRTNEASELYSEVAELMFSLATRQPGYLELESVRDSTGQGITVSYWDSLESIRRWKGDVDHQLAQKQGKEVFYDEYHVRIAKVEREYTWRNPRIDNTV
jgi:heme-degrading monooxygenase HmoA